MANRTLTKLVRRATLGGAAIVAIGITGGGLNQSPAAIPDDPFAGLVPMSEAMLASRRGGISAPAVPFGLNIQLGGNFTATIDGTVVLETIFTVTGNNLVITETTLPNITVPNITVPNFGNRPVTFVEAGGAPVTLGDGGQVTVPAGFTGVVTEGPDGVVAVLQRITDDQIATIAVSTDTGRTVVSNLDLTLAVGNFGNVQGGQTLNNLAQNINRDLRSAILGTLKN